MGDLATRNLKLFIGFRATTRAILFAPYIFHFMTVIRGMSAEEYGILQAVYYVGCVLTEIPSGIAADRWGRKRPLFLGALASLWFFQVVRADHYRGLSDSNRIRTLAMPPLRGVITDRNGVVLAKNRPSFTVAVESVPPARWATTRDRLSRLLAK